MVIVIIAAIIMVVVIGIITVAVIGVLVGVGVRVAVDFGVAVGSGIVAVLMSVLMLCRTALRVVGSCFMYLYSSDTIIL